MARRKQSKKCRADATVRPVRMRQVGQRDDVSTRKRSQSTFALVTGQGREDIASVAPSKATGARDWKNARLERAADALLGEEVPAPYRAGDTTTNENR